MSVLLACPQGHRWELPTGAAPANGSSVCPECGAAASTEAPVVPGYEILAELGRGARAVVYRARQLNPDRLVALKMILSDEYAGEAERAARFKTEAEAVAKLHHPNLVEIYEVGDLNGRPFFSEEFVNGGSLADQLDGEPWRPRPAAGLVETLARAVHVAHQAGVVHRGLKPANVLMTMDGQPKIADFGLLGAPSYLAPEQVVGKSKPIGPAADVHALGAILYQLLTGRPPFQAAAPLDAVVQMVGEPPVPPRQVQSAVPLDIEVICLKCLQKEPARRYASAEALAQDLARFLDGKRVAAARDRGGRRRDPAALLTMVVLLLLGAVIGAVCWFAAAAHDALQLRAETLNGRRNHYDAQMGLVRLAWEENDRQALPELLDELRPENTGGVDLRGFEWYFWSHRQPGGDPDAVFHGDPNCVFSPDGARLAAVGADGDVKIWDVADHKEVRTISWKDERPPPPPPPRVVGMGAGGPVKGPGQPPPAVQPSEPAKETRTLVFSPNGTRLAGWSPQGPVHVWDTADGKELFVLKDGSPHKGAGGFLAVEYTPDGKTLVYACSSQDGWVGAWDAETGQFKSSQDIAGLAAELMEGKTGGAAFSPDRQRLALAPVHAAEVWDVAKGTRLFHTDAICRFVAFSPDGRLLAGGDATSRTVVVWDAATGKRTAELKEHPSVVATAAADSAVFSPDSRRLAAVNSAGVRVWDVETTNELLSLKGMTSVRFSPDGRFLACGDADGTIRVWNVGR